MNVLDKLHEISDSIANLERTILDAKEAAADAKEELDRLETRYKKKAANDDELTNRTKRKAYVSGQKESAEYQDVKSTLAESERKIEELQIQLRAAQRKFEIAKIEANSARTNAAQNANNIADNITNGTDLT